MPRRDLIAKARALRKSMTPQEARLWLQLRAMRAEGFPFRRQSPLCGYILDFVCIDRRLVVEVDGGQHVDDRQSEHDFVRDRVLERAGFTTLRVTNADVNTNLMALSRRSS